MSDTYPQTYQNRLYNWLAAGDECLIGCFCPCILYGKTALLLEHGHRDGLLRYPCLNEACVVYSIVGVMSAGIGLCSLQTRQRAYVRRRIGITGSVWTDCVISFFCLPCSLVQDAQEANDWRLHNGAYAQDGSELLDWRRATIQYSLETAIQPGPQVTMECVAQNGNEVKLRDWDLAATFKAKQRS